MRYERSTNITWYSMSDRITVKLLIWSWNCVFWFKPSGLFIETTQSLHSKSFRSVSSNARPNKKGIFTVEKTQNVSRLFPSRKDHPRCLRANIKNSFSNSTSMLDVENIQFRFWYLLEKKQFFSFHFGKINCSRINIFPLFSARPTWAVTRMLCIINFHINQPYHPDDDGDC